MSQKPTIAELNATLEQAAKAADEAKAEHSMARTREVAANNAESQAIRNLKAARSRLDAALDEIAPRERP